MNPRRFPLLLAFLLILPIFSAIGPATAAEPSVAEKCGPVPGDGSGVPSTTEGGFHAIQPVRLADTRYTTGTVGAGCTLVVDTSGVIPASATAAAISVTSVDAVYDGFITAYPCDAARPLASTLNMRAGDITPNAAVVPLENSRRLCFYTSMTTQIVVDLTGYFAINGEPYHGVQPDRVLDTRYGPRPDGGSGQLAAGSVTRIPMAGRGSIGAQANGVIMNITVTDTASAGFITAYPCGTSRPNASNVNFLAGDTRANQAVVGLSGTGDVCIYTMSTVSLVVDVSGWFGGPDGDRLVPIVGSRVLDSRSATGGWSGMIRAGQTQAVDVTRQGALPVGLNAVLNVVSVDSTEPGFLTLFPCGASRPPTSTLNYQPGLIVANMATVPVGQDGQVCVYSHKDTHVVIDVNGSLGSPGPLLGLSVPGAQTIPRFTPDGNNYGVICPAATNTWNLGLNAVKGATITVNGAPARTVTVAPDDLVTVTVTTAAGQSTDYFVRCLPADFPKITSNRRDAVEPGWYLVAPTGSTYGIILDEYGAPVWYHDNDMASADLKLLPNGNLAWTPLLGPTYGVTPDGAFREMALDGTIVRTWATVGVPTDHHDMIPLPNGNMLMMSYPVREGVDVTALGPGYEGQTSAKVVDFRIQEIAPDGSLVWEWASEDHIGVAETTAQKDNRALLLTRSWTWVPVDPPIYDIIHANSLEYINDGTGDILVSARHLDAAFRISRSTGEIVWKLGGNAPTNPATVHLTLINDPEGGPHRQHDARIAPTGNVTLYDNNTDRSNLPARAVEYSVNVAAGTATLVREWVQPAGIQSSSMGSARLLPSDGMVVGWASMPNSFSEYLPGITSRPAFEFYGGGSSNYRTVKLPKASFDETQLRTVVGAA